MDTLISLIQSSDCEFWSNFSPNFWATMAGAIIGIPIALFLNQIRANSEDKKKHKDELEILYKSLNTLSEAFPRNRDLMVSMIGTADKKALKENFEIDYSTWDIVKSDVVKILQNPEFQYKLNYYFSRLQYLVKVYDLYNTLAFETIRFRSTEKEEKTIPEKKFDELFEGIIKYLKKLLPELIDLGDILKGDIQKQMSDIRKKIGKK